MCSDPTQPRPQRYTDAMTIGVDLGGSKIEGDLIDEVTQALGSAPHRPVPWASSGRRAAITWR